MQAKTNEIVSGAVYNALTLTGNYSFVQTSVGRRMVVEAQCKCGVIKNYPLRFLQTGNTKSCGCVRREKMLASKTTHNLSKHPLYSVYQDMKRRCYIEKCVSFKDYGARGIKVCDEWFNDVKAFCDWGMANGYQKGVALDRKETNGNYEPSNCRFVTQAINNTTTRRVKRITAFGETKCAAEWARDERCKISASALSDRVSSKRWKAEDAITSSSNERHAEICRVSKSARLETAFGEKKSLIDWSEDKRCTVSYSGLKNRLFRGWDIEKAISFPAS